MPGGLRWLIAACLLCSGAVAPAPAWAQQGAQPADARPAASEQERKAQELYRAGNELFVNRSYAEALAKYEAAVALWDHAAIRYNMAECYISLVKPLQAYGQLELALAEGRRPFAAAPEIYERGLQLKDRLLAQLGQLKLVASQSNVRITLDGSELELEGGVLELVISPGAHQLVASSPGFLTSSQSIVLSPDERREVELVLAPVPVPRVERRRWHRWLPWGVAGAGAALMVAGSPLMALADSNYRDYERAINDLCSPTSACELADLPAGTQALRTRGDQQKLAAQVLWSTGGAVLTAGAILTLLNQPRMVELERANRLPVQAEIGPGGASLTIGWRY